MNCYQRKWKPVQKSLKPLSPPPNVLSLLFQSIFDRKKGPLSHFMDCLEEKDKFHLIHVNRDFYYHRRHLFTIKIKKIDLRQVPLDRSISVLFEIHNLNLWSNEDFKTLYFLEPGQIYFKGLSIRSLIHDWKIMELFLQVLKRLSFDNLELKSNSFSTENKQTIKLIELFKRKSYKCLKLSGNSFHNNMEHIAELIKTNETITEFSLSDRIPANSVSSLVEAFQTNKTLRKVTVSFTCLEPPVFVLFLDSFLNTSIEWLDLEGNEIDEKCGEKIAQILQTSKTLQSLHLEFAKLEQNGVAAISQGLKVNKTLTLLNLSNNSHIEYGMDDLAEALLENTTLKEIHLTHNRFQNHHVDSFIGMLQTNTSLKVLNLSDNNLSDASLLVESLLINTGLEKIHLSMNIFGDNSVQTFSTLVKRKKPLVVEIFYNSLSKKNKKVLEKITQTTDIHFY